jgi:hypothetical protein
MTRRFLSSAAPTTTVVPTRLPAECTQGRMFFGG